MIVKTIMLTLALSLLSCATFASEPDTGCLPTSITTATNKTILLQLESAITPKSREIGLMYRTTMGRCDGMAFFFPRPLIQKFWMKNTYIPLDILFVDDSFSIIYIAHAKPLSLEAVGPETPSATVIEIAAGRAEKEGIRVGDKVQYDVKPFSKNLGY